MKSAPTLNTDQLRSLAAGRDERQLAFGFLAEIDQAAATRKKKPSSADGERDAKRRVRRRRRA
jgi:hypothetical protein